MRQFRKHYSSKYTFLYIENNIVKKTLLNALQPSIVCYHQCMYLYTFCKQMDKLFFIFLYIIFGGSRQAGHRCWNIPLTEAWFSSEKIQHGPEKQKEVWRKRLREMDKRNKEEWNGVRRREEKSEKGKIAGRESVLFSFSHSLSLAP